MNAYDNDLHLTRNLAQESANRASYLRSLTGRNILFGSAAVIGAAGVGIAAMIWAWNQGLDPEVLKEALAKMPPLTVNPVTFDPEAKVKIADGETVKLESDTLKLDAPDSIKLLTDQLTLAPGQTVTLDAGTLTEIIKQAQQKPLVQPDLSNQPQKTKSGDVIKREVTVFSEVAHATGRVVTGWKYHDGESKTPFDQFCYYGNPDYFVSSEQVAYIGKNGKREDSASNLVPDFLAAYNKCVWHYAGATKSPSTKKRKG